LCSSDECVLLSKLLLCRPAILVQKAVLVLHRPHFSSTGTQNSLVALSILQIADNGCMPCQIQSYCVEQGSSPLETFCRVALLRCFLRDRGCLYGHLSSYVPSNRLSFCHRSSDCVQRLS